MLKRTTNVIAGFFAAGAIAVAALASSEARAATKDVDLLFIIDRSGSMGGEFLALANNIEAFFNALSADTRTGSVAGGLVTYLSTPTLEQAITTNVATLKSAISGVSVGGSTENGIGAIDSVLPGGSLFSTAGWRSNTVKSTILITDEDADDESGPTPYADLATRVSGVGYLNNIISDVSDWGPAAVPSTGVFSLSAFNSDPTGFLSAFATAKLGEIDTTPTTPGAVPLPAGLPLLLTALGGLGFAGWRRRRTDTA